MDPTLTPEAKEYCELLKKIIQQHPDHFVAYNKLGAAFFILKKWEDAIQAFEKALEIEPGYFEAKYNLALALTKQENFEKAIPLWQSLLEQTPNHPAAHFHLGCCYMAQKKFKDAEKSFTINIQQNPAQAEAYHNLATCYLEQGALNEARQQYQMALTFAPNDTDILFNLGVIASAQNDFDRAIRYYQHLLSIDPNFLTAHYNLGIAFMIKKHNEFAIDHFTAALQLKPDDKNIEYLIEILKPQKNIRGAPESYIENLFDAYANHYEHHLVRTLHYTLPDLFFNAAKKICHLKKESLNLLDLGCGTGLCSAPFKPFTKICDGVDLSEKMLMIAKAKNIFTSLTRSEILLYLKDKKELYDIILAGDVCVYFGELEKLFIFVAQSLRQNGFFIFNTEISLEKNFTMHQSGRFGHSENYIKSLAKQNHLSIRKFETIQSRIQNNEPVPAFLVVLEKNQIK